jgi:hypothetical protein
MSDPFVLKGWITLQLFFPFYYFPLFQQAIANSFPFRELTNNSLLYQINYLLIPREIEGFFLAKIFFPNPWLMYLTDLLKSKYPIAPLLFLRGERIGSSYFNITEKFSKFLNGMIMDTNFLCPVIPV